jgi:hypothetical protein
VVPALFAAACSDTALDPDTGPDRSSQIDAVDADIRVQPNGTVTVSETVTFAGDDGGTLAIGGTTLGAGLQNTPITLPPGTWARGA